MTLPGGFWPGEWPFRLGLAGAGRMGRSHLAALRTSEAVELVGVADPSPEARAVAAADGLTACATVDELLSIPDLHGVLVATPTDTHLEVVRTVVSHGLPVLCEKPCGTSVEEVEACAAAAKRAGVILRVAYWRRFVPALVTLRQRMRAGDLGRLLAVNCYQWDASPPDAEFREHSGGILIDMGVHEFDQLRWLTGSEITHVDVIGSRDHRDGTDPDCVQLVAGLTDGATAMVSLGRWHPAGDTCKVEVFGTGGTEECCFVLPDGGNAVVTAALRCQAESFAREVRLAGLPEGGAATSGDSEGPIPVGAMVADAVAALHLAGLAKRQLAGRRSAAPLPPAPAGLIPDRGKGHG
jgi:myo-inositol 2-dehydrogenase/D-chiro-inositol 1-dehydrogenase